MSLATSHLHTARLWASSPRVFEHFIHSLNPEHRLPETSECLGMLFENLARGQSTFYSLRVVAEKVAAPGSECTGVLSEVFTPWAAVMSCVHS